MWGKTVLQRSWRSFRLPLHFRGRRNLSRAWLQWMFLLGCIVFLRMLWIWIPSDRHDAKEDHREALAARQTIERHKSLQERLEALLPKEPPSVPDVIQSKNVASFVLPVLVIACNRPTVKRTLDALLKYRSELHGLHPEQFPITVSHGCVHNATSQVLQSYGPAINVVTFQDSMPSTERTPVAKGYQAVARHYKHALNRMFLQLNHSALIIVEDDLDVASDFFQYFAATLPLLMGNQNLFCVSAWNDNGRPELIDPGRPDLLYRTDFFSGLGWMLLRSFWLEIHTGWPDIFWDEYLRKPYVRKGRACLRPELSRTVTFGRTGISRGQFFDKYLSTMRLNTAHQNFIDMDLTYLHEPHYSKTWHESVYRDSVEVPLDRFLRDDLPAANTLSTKRIRVTYTSQNDFNRIADKLNLMKDIKSGVMRNGFAGVVPVKWRDFWVYIAPVSSWTAYDESWT